METETKLEWEIKFEDYLSRIGKTQNHFRESLKLPPLRKTERVVPLRYLKNIISITQLTKNLLFEILSQIKTLDGQRPFKNASFKVIHVDPKDLKVGQKYVYTENWTELIRDFSEIFCVDYVFGSGLTSLGAYMAYGTVSENENDCAIAFYIPPIVEQHSNGLVIMDGMHRNWIIKQVGVTISVIKVENISVPFPCSCQAWREVKDISLTQKPKDINERYFDLRQNLFRDLKYLGIDG